MKITNILGSPRKNGTSARIARAFTETATGLGAEVTHYYLNGMQYRGCQGCEGCHTRSIKCILKDDVTAVLEDLYTTDIAVFSAPVYFGDTCGQFKAFYDRMWSLIDPHAVEHSAASRRLPPGKNAVLILTQVDADSSHQDVLERYSYYLRLYGFDLRVLTAAGLRIEPNIDITDSLREAALLARELVG